MSLRPKTADICLLVEGSYPYVRGGVSTWVHDLITAQKHYTFSVVTILAKDDEEKESRYPYPDNLISVTHCSLSDLPKAKKSLNKHNKETLHLIEQKIITFFTKAGLQDFKDFLELLHELKGARGSFALLDSQAAWDLMLNTYEKLMPQNSFLDYFWSFRALLESLYSVLLVDIPPARLYHTTCTGYAGLLGARCHLETGRPLILTEHGIYTNERRVELLSANWLYRNTDDARNYTINRTRLELRDLWISTFTNYSKICYEACSEIVTLYRGNQLTQMADGASPQKMEIIPNGIDFERFSAVERLVTEGRKPTIAFIGRVVPIKDVKTFIRTCNILKSLLPELSIYIIGPYEENVSYYEECFEMVEHMGLKDRITFTGNVNIMDYLPLIDVLVLTSISEAQPLVILEAGAAGIPTVATKVGACREIINGKEEEFPPLGDGGIIVPISNPGETARALFKLLTDAEYYASCSKAIKERVRLYYNKDDQHETYHALYDSYLGKQKAVKG